MFSSTRSVEWVLWSVSVFIYQHSTGLVSSLGGCVCLAGLPSTAGRSQSIWETALALYRAEAVGHSTVNSRDDVSWKPWPCQPFCTRLLEVVGALPGCSPHVQGNFGFLSRFCSVDVSCKICLGACSFVWVGGKPCTYPSACLQLEGDNWSCGWEKSAVSIFFLWRLEIYSQWGGSLGRGRAVLSECCQSQKALGGGLANLRHLKHSSQALEEKQSIILVFPLMYIFSSLHCPLVCY